jgi:glycerol-3-phosphate acyltransferase PlsY
VNWWLFLIVGYVLGSIPFGIILTQLGGAGDLRQIGSGNIGATNVLRTGRKGLAAATLLLDGAKGFAAVWLAWHSVDNVVPVVPLTGLAALIGHCFPIWLGFRGGKGVATMLGIDFALDWRIGLAAVIVWLAVARLSRISSLGGMSSAIAAPIVALALGFTVTDCFLCFLERAYFNVTAIGLAMMAGLVVFQHRENIARLRAGTEPRIGGSKSA